MSTTNTQLTSQQSTSNHKHLLSVRFGSVTKDNWQQVRRLNISLFPVRYSDSFYRDLYTKQELKPIIKLAYHSDILVGAVCCRYETLSNTPNDNNNMIEETKTNDINNNNTNNNDNNKENKQNNINQSKPQDKHNKIDKIHTNTSDSEYKRIYIMTLGVLSTYRNYGIGRKLLESIIEYAKSKNNITEIFLHVQTSNEDAINFYKKFDFEIVGKIENYYKRITPTDCYIVSRKIRTIDANENK